MAFAFPIKLILACSTSLWAADDLSILGQEKSELKWLGLHESDSVDNNSSFQENTLGVPLDKH